MRRIARLSIRWRLALTSAGLTFAILLLFALVIGTFTVQRLGSDFDNDVRAADQAYNSLERTEVLGWLDLACAELASVIDEVRADDWTRTGLLAGEERDALAVARDGAHEGAHHLRDVQRVLTVVRGRPSTP